MNFSTSGPPAQFSHQVTRLQFPKDVHFGDDISIWIAKVGDVALGNMYLRVDWPMTSTVDDSAGTRMIDFVELRYENDLLERHYGESLEIMNDLSVTAGKQQVLTTLIGKGITSNLAAYYIRMPFKLNLPLCALDKAPVFRVKFRPSQEFSSLNWTAAINVNLFVDYVYITKAERDYFKKAKIDYLTHTIQRLEFTVESGISKPSFLTEFTRPVKELYWVIQTFGASSYDFTNQGAEQLTSLRLQFNGVDVILPEIGTPLFLRTIQGLESHTRVPDRKFYMYPFALDPEHPNQPTGSVNMSVLTRQLHTLELSQCYSSRKVRIYALTHNVVRIADGSATSLFDAVQEGGTTTRSSGNVFNIPTFANPGTQSFNGGGSISVSQTAIGTGTLTWSISPSTGVTLTNPSTSGVTVVVSPYISISATSYTLTALNSALTSCVQTFSITNIAIILSAPVFANPGTQSFNDGGSISVSQTATGTGTLTWSISPSTSGVTLTSPSTSGVTVVVSPYTNIPTTSYTLTATNLALTSCSQTFSITNVGILYPFSTFTFTNADATGSTGPTSLAAYGTSYPGYGTLYALALSGGIQYWTVPATATYTFTLAGAGSSYPGSSNAIKQGYGIVMNATYSLTKNQLIAILVGQLGIYGPDAGGGTFIASVTGIGNLSTATPLFVAGGAAGVGGQANVGSNDNIDGTISTTGRNGKMVVGVGAGTGGIGPAGGTTPTVDANSWADGGAGFSGNGEWCRRYKGVAYVPKSFTNGGTGGTNSTVGIGGFGGGAALGSYQLGEGGGGGGYGGGGSGGSSTDGAGGGGGGSYDVSGAYSGSATNSGHGYVTITKV